jgi:hypothetical protein
MSNSDPSQLQTYVDARQRPAVFLFTGNELPLWRSHVLQLYELLADRRFDELDLVIHSGGGSAHAAYQTIELLRLHVERVNVCVPFWAKSAATLLCIGGDQIVLGEHAELGPLDVQVYEEKKAGKGEYSSALNVFKSLEQLQTASIEALASAMRFIVETYEMSYDESLQHAIAFVGATTGPLVSRLDPHKLGQYSRELSVAIEYGQRLLTRYGGRSEQDASRLVETLVYGYPSHDYIIDLKELLNLGFSVDLFAPAERSAAKELLDIVDHDLVALREPATLSDEQLAEMVAASPEQPNGGEDAAHE